MHDKHIYKIRNQRLLPKLALICKTISLLSVPSFKKIWDIIKFPYKGFIQKSN